MNDLSCGIIMWAQVSLVLSQHTCLTDRQTDRRTESPSQYRALHYMQSHGNKTAPMKGCRAYNCDAILQALEMIDRQATTVHWATVTTVLSSLRRPSACCRRRSPVNIRSPLASVTPLRLTRAHNWVGNRMRLAAGCNMQSRATRDDCCRPVNPLIYGDRRPPSPLTLRYSHRSPNMGSARPASANHRGPPATRLAGAGEPSFTCASRLGQPALAR